MNSIPENYQRLWRPFMTKMILYHLTTDENLKKIKQQGLIPNDPAPKYWTGMKAIFLSFPNDPLFQKVQKDVTDHVREKGQKLVKLHIKTKNQLYRCQDPKRTFQVISLTPIKPDEITKIEKVTI